jgi:hypothetical protein
MNSNKTSADNPLVCICVCMCVCVCTAVCMHVCACVCMYMHACVRAFFMCGMVLPQAPPHRPRMDMCVSFLVSVSSTSIEFRDSSLNFATCLPTPHFPLWGSALTCQKRLIVCDVFSSPSPFSFSFSSVMSIGGWFLAPLSIDR